MGLNLNIWMMVLSVILSSRVGAGFGSRSCYTSIFSFGDSLIDTGNYLHLYPNDYIGRPPYGISYFHRPTGRHSDGRVILDFIAESVGIPLVSPYLSHTTDQDLRWGANFAVAGATALDGAFFEVRKIQGIDEDNISLKYQIQWFNQLLPSFCGTPSGCHEFLKRSLFLVGEIGGNDYFKFFTSGWSFEELGSIVPHIINITSSAIEVLIEKGAKTLVVPGSLPIGCLSAVLTIGLSSDENDYDPTTGCLKKWNKFNEHHNHLLQAEVDRLQILHPYATIIYADYFNVSLHAFRSPHLFGFSSKKMLTACCGGGGPYNFNSSAPCASTTANVCEDPSSSWNWDGSHPTEAGQRIIAKGLLEGPYAIPALTSLSCLTSQCHSIFV